MTSTLPAWIAPTLNRTAGRDPLALQTITQDRIIPSLLPGILALSRRARYLSFHCYLLDEYGRRKLPASNAALGKFILAREYDFALAVEMCPRQCGSSPVGRDRTGSAAAVERDSYERGESVENALGGYGLYYRSPLADLGLVARIGTILGDEPTPIDVLVPGGRGRELAAAFRSAVSQTAYVSKHFTGLAPTPRGALVEYSAKACLCRLDENISERNLLRVALFEAPSGASESAAQQRRLSFALFLNSIATDSEAAERASVFRRCLWDEFLSRQAFGESRARVTSQWTALVLKEYMQEALSSMWIDLCRTGLRKQPDEGFTPEELTQVLRQDLAAARPLDLDGTTISFAPNMSMRDLNRRVASAASKMSLEDLRKWTRDQESAIAGIVYLQTVCDRLPSRDAFSETDRAFLDIGVQRSLRQEGLLQVARALTNFMEADPSVADTIEWALRRMVIDVHERVAYSKLPNFTFRFRWENGRLRFYNLGVWPFDLADMRHGSLSQLSFDLGYWHKTSDGSVLTKDGRSFIAGAFE